MNDFVFTATSQVIYKEIVPNFLTVLNAEPGDIHQINAPAHHSETDLHVKLLNNPGGNGKGTRTYHNFQIITTGVSTVQEIIK